MTKVDWLAAGALLRVGGVLLHSKYSLLLACHQQTPPANGKQARP
jgi:hypothetical protein